MINRLRQRLILPLLCLVGWCAALGSTHAQVVQTPRSVWTPPRLIINAPNLQPVVLDAVKLDTEVHGTEALTRLELRFVNPNGRILEGELQFPLLAGQSVIGMAMDVNGVLREAVPVDKAKGQEVFEDVIRQRIDPALLEKTQGNNFKLRVYPIPANGTKRVVLRILETLPLRSGHIVLRLPLNYADKLAHLDLTLKVFSADVPQASLGSQTGVLTFARQGAVYEARLQRENFVQRDLLEVRVPAPSSATVTTQRFNGQTYFRVALPAPAAKPSQRTLPKHVALYWDASASGLERDQAREFALLDAYFKAMGQGSVTLVTFRDVVEKPQTFTIEGGNWSRLKAQLTQTPFDGATRYGGLPKVAGAGEALLVSDGINNYGKEALPALGMPVFAVSSVVSADAAALQSMAERSGGRLIDLQRLTPKEAVAQLLNDGVQMADVGGVGVSQLVQESRWPQDGRFMLAGVVAPGGGTLQVQLHTPGTPALRTVEIAVPAPTADAPSSALAALTWARLKLAELDGDYTLKRGEIRRLGQLFRLPTRETSLIILDRAEDYARHDVEAPPELAVEVARLKAMGVSNRDADRGRHLERIATQFQAKVTWWQRDFADEARALAERKDRDAKTPTNRPDIPINSSNPRSIRSKWEGRVALARSRNEESLEAPPLAFVPPPDVAPIQSAATPPPPMPSPISTATFAARTVEVRGSPAAAPGQVTAGIALQKWTPDAPYIRRLKEAEPNQIYAIYLDERPTWRNSSAFYLDVADLLTDTGQTALALRVLSNIAEMNLENRHLLRILAYRLMQVKEPKLAIAVLEKVRDLAPNEPQSHRDLGLAFAANQQAQKAVDALWEVVSTPWPRSFPDMPLIALAELNALIATADDKPDTSRIDPRLLNNLPLDLRVTLSWDADNSDMDLHVTDPNGEEASFRNPLTVQGGRMSPDNTMGYGPEEFSLKKAKPGKYMVRANFYGHRQQVVAGATTLQLKLQTGFGTPKQQEKIVTLRLQGQASMVTVGEFEVK